MYSVDIFHHLNIYIFKYSRPFCDLNSNKFAKSWPSSATGLFKKYHKIIRKNIFWKYLSFSFSLASLGTSSHHSCWILENCFMISTSHTNHKMKISYRWRKNYFQRNQSNVCQSCSRTRSSQVTPFGPFRTVSYFPQS